jgi:hypothetical protein
LAARPTLVPAAREGRAEKAKETIYMHRGFSATKLVVLAAVVGAVSVGSYAFTASNTVAVTPAGEGASSTISGYTSTNNIWTIDATDATKIQKVAFHLSGVTANTTTYAGADNGTTITWSDACVQTNLALGAADETCTFSTQPLVSGTTKLAISAAN